ncbi:MAG: hypothetical protein OJI67_10945 [Prosthecobacter sp.]|nr:hypothetical protein [Prosthecobacter sp.]
MTTNFIDIYRSQLCGTQINERFDCTSIAEAYQTDSLPAGIFSYKSLSLVVGVEADILKWFAVDTLKSRAFKRWSWFYDGRPLSLSRYTSPDDFNVFMGQAVESWDDGVEVCRTYNVIFAQLRCVWGGDQKLRSLEWN